MVLVAAALGVLGMIFTMGIVVGLIVSLRSRADAAGAELDSHAATVAAAAGAAVVPVPAAPPSAPAAAAVSPAPAVKVAPSKKPLVEGSADTLVVAKADSPAAPPSPPPRAPARAVHWAPVAVAAPATKPPPAVNAAKRGRVNPSDSDFDAANAASELAKAQLDASLR